MNTIKNDMMLIIENQKLVIGEILGLKTRIEVLERQDVNKNIAIDNIVESLLHQKRIIQQKLNQVDESIFYLNGKLEECRNNEIIQPSETSHKKSVKICKFNRTGFCRERENCLYFHGLKDCQEFSDSGVCLKPKCSKRHPKTCIYFQRGECQWGSRCKYLHKVNLEIVENVDESLDDCEKEPLDQLLAKNIECKECKMDDKCINCIMKYAMSPEFLDEVLLNSSYNSCEDESIETIMAKAKAFEEEDIQGLMTIDL